MNSHRLSSLCVVSSSKSKQRYCIRIEKIYTYCVCVSLSFSHCWVYVPISFITFAYVPKIRFQSELTTFFSSTIQLFVLILFNCFEFLFISNKLAACMFLSSIKILSYTLVCALDGLCGFFVLQILRDVIDFSWTLRIKKDATYFYLTAIYICILQFCKKYI